MTGLLALTVVFGFFADGIYTYTLQRAGQKAVALLRKELFAHCLALPRNYYDKHPIGFTLSRLTSDMEAIGESVAIGVLALFTDFIKTVALLIFLFYLSWKLTLVVLVTLPVILFVVTFLRKKLRLYYNSSRESLARTTAYLQECLNGMKTIQLYASEKKTLNRFMEKNREFLEAQTKSNLYDASLFSIIEGLTTVAMVLMIWYGTSLILSGVITIGVLIGFINTLSKIFIPIREFAQQIALIQRALSALEHIQGLFLEKTDHSYESEAKRDSSPNLRTFQDLSFENVSFSYDSSPLKVLDQVTFSLKKGERIAIVGTTGSGKSTLLKLLIKAYSGYQGSIKLNGIELNQISREELRNLVTIMLQDVFLFNESINFNISLNRPEINQENINKAVEYVYAHEFIEQLPDKFEFQLIDNGRNLSSGQAQLISFARAIAGGCELILLDEATSSVDSVTENLIQKAIEKIFKEKTVIAVAHRLSTIINSDLILVMKQGKIVETGNHNSLKEKKGYYVKLLNQIESMDKNKQIDDYSLSK